MAKNAKFLELGPANVYLFVPPKATLLTTNTNANGHIYLEAVLGGAAGNLISIALVNPGTANSPLSISVVGTAITVSLATNGAGVVSSVANDVINALTGFLDVTVGSSILGIPTGFSSPAASLVQASRQSGEDGTGVIQPQTATFLAGGSDAGVQTEIGFVGEGLVYQVTTEAANLTGAQTGNVPQDKVVIGGMVKVVIPFKEITPDNFFRAIPLARLIQNNDKSKRRIDFLATVGLSLRARAQYMQISKIKGGFESPLTSDTIIIPQISPAEGEVNFPFHPTTQREILSNWYAWPDPTTGRWSYTGDTAP